LKGTTSTPGPDQETGEVTFSGKQVVICLGNRYLRDDGIGIQVAEDLRDRNLGEDILVDACQTVDLSLLCHCKGASKVVLVDALKSGAPPGTVSKYNIVPDEGPFVSLPGLHELQLHDLFDIARQTGFLTCPVTIIGVEPKDCSVGEGLSAELVNALPDVLVEVTKELNDSRH
jgi:hydrogenase maturation protease